MLHLRYTARDGGRALRDQVITEVVTPSRGRIAWRLFSAKNEFPGEWNRFLNPANDQQEETLALPLSPERFPYQPGGKVARLTRVDVFLKLKEHVPYTDGDVTISITPPSPQPEGPGQPMNVLSVTTKDGDAVGVPHAPVASGGAPGTWTIRVKAIEAQSALLRAGTSGPPRIDPAAIVDIGVICQFVVPAE